MTDKANISIILPARNESGNLKILLPKLIESYPEDEIIVVNDGSTDTTVDVCNLHDIKIISHPYSMGNGAAIKTGVRNSAGTILILMDADGQHNPDDIPRLIEKLDSGFDMVVGARQNDTHASLLRRVGNTLYNWLASRMTGFPIADLTSGFRAVRARHFKRFLYLLPNKFSYPTTSTMAFFRSGLPVGYVPIHAIQRQGDGKSHIRIFHDGIRFFIIILKIGALFSPMRFFLPISGMLLLLGLGYYGYTYMNSGRFTNMSAVLLLASLFTFLISIVSEQISALHYKDIEESKRRTTR